MTPQQEANLSLIQAEFASGMDAKYRAGAAEHGTCLEDLPAERLADEAMGEALDQVSYLTTLRPKLRAAMADVARIDALAALRGSCEVAIWFNAAGGWSIEWHDGVDKIYAAATLREALDLALEGRKVQ